MNRLPSPLVMHGLETAEKHLGIDGLCQRLGTTRTAIQAWRMGHVEMPDRDFVALVDLLTDLEPGWMSAPQS
ncbi:MAG: hypothetical protein ABR570_00245 [Burkholderiales bacterium]